MRKLLAFLTLTACGAAAHASEFSTDWEGLVISYGPYVQQVSFPGPVASAELGAAVAMWHDSTTDADWLIAGAPVENLFTGAAYIYHRAAGHSEWTLDARLSAPDETPGSEFGFSVAIDDGTVVVTAPLHIDSFFVGAAYVFVRDPTTGMWIQQGSEFNRGTGFGIAAALSRNTLAISDPDADKVYIYHRVADTWGDFATLATPSGISADSSFGASLWTDGETLLVGAPNDSTVASLQGSVAIYSLTSDTRAPYQIIRPEIETSPGQSFGTSAVLTTHGIMVGAPHATNGVGDVDSYLFDPTTSLWGQQSKLMDTDGALLPSPIPGFGQSVASYGNLLVAGDPRLDRATIYVYAGDTWQISSTLHGNLTSWFGYGVAAANGIVGVGALLDGSAQQGSVSIFIDDRIFADGFGY